ncbi:MAG TPA: FAD-dependent oxidoreductase [Myxococcota bacterium]|nr:FAD-dependent oxidoreductase [Myxococcota bacterium]
MADPKQDKKARAPSHAAHARPASDVKRWSREADVVIVGFGGAGSCAALEARAAGAEVLVLERAWAGGGTSMQASGQLYMGGGTPLQKACGFDDDPDEMFKYLVASCGPGADEEKLRVYCDGSVEHYHWVTGQGVPFKQTFLPVEVGTDPYTDDGLSYTGSELAWPFCEIAKPAPRGHTAQQVGENAGQLMMEILMRRAQEAGAQVVTDALCEPLIVERDGRVAGVVAKIGDEEHAIRARRGVVLAAGGYIHNKDMVARYAPRTRRVRFRLGCDGDDGRGIRMGMGAGGDAIRMEAACVVVPFSRNRGFLKGVLINQHGQRFCNEDLYQSLLGEICLWREQGRIWLALDDAVYEKPQLPTEIAAVGETWEEVEREAKCFPPGSLSRTMALYNESAARGEDPQFRKEARWLKPLTTPPFVLLDLTIEKYPFWSAFTLGGLHTRHTGEVLDADGAVVPGLYAAGRNASGLPAHGYNSGLSLADATWSGRLAGRAAAKARG